MTNNPYFVIVPCRRLEDHLSVVTSASVIVEKELRIILNERPLATAALTPGMEREFVTGYLFGQRFLNHESINIMSISLSGEKAIVTLPGLTSPVPYYRIVTGGGKTAFVDTDQPSIASQMKICRQVIFDAMNCLFDKAVLYQETEGVHAAGLFRQNGEPLCIAEDIGRHNCLDKIIGWALLNNIDLSECLLVSTGRMASEMVAKLCRAGIPIAATKAAVTDQGRETAKATGLTLIGFVRDAGNQIRTNMETRIIKEQSMKIYSNPERIIN